MCRRSGSIRPTVAVPPLEASAVQVSGAVNAQQPGTVTARLAGQRWQQSGLAGLELDLGDRYPSRADHSPRGHNDQSGWLTVA